MKCSECGADIFDSVAKCPFCKTPTSTVKNENFKNFDFTYTITSKEQIKAIRDTVAEVSEKKSLFSAKKTSSTESPRRKSHSSIGRKPRRNTLNKKKIMGVAIIGVALLCVIALIWGIISLIGALVNKNTVISSYTYIKENGLYMIYNSETVKLTDHVISKDYIRQANDDETLESVSDIMKSVRFSYSSEDGMTTYFFEDYNPETNSGTLKTIRKGKEKSIKTITDDVYNSVTINNEGTSALFLQSTDKNGDMGVLYYWNDNMKEPYKLSSDIDHGTFAFSSDSDEALYIQNLDRTVMQGDLYTRNLKNLKKEKIKIDNDVCYIFGTDNKGENYIYAKAFDPADKSFEIYTCGIKPDSARIRLGERTKLPPYMYETKNNMLVYGINEDGTHNLYYVNIKNGDKEKISSGVNQVVKVSEDENYVMYNKVYNESTADFYIYSSGKQPQKVAENVNISSVDIKRAPQLAVSDDLHSVVYISGFDPRTGSGKLFLTNFKPGKETDPTHISDDVHSCHITANGNIIYTKDYSINRKVFDVYSYNKKSSNIIKDELTSDMFEISENGNTIFYVTGFNTDKKVGDFKISDLEGNSNMLSGDVFGFNQSDSGDVFFYKNHDKTTGKFDLHYLPNGKTNFKLIDSKIDCLMLY